MFRACRPRMPPMPLCGSAVARVAVEAGGVRCRQHIALVESGACARTRFATAVVRMKTAVRYGPLRRAPIAAVSTQAPLWVEQCVLTAC